MPEELPGQEKIDHEAARKRARTIAALVAALVVAGVVVGLVLGLTHPSHHHRSVLVGVLVAVGAVAVVLIVALPLLLRLYRRPQYARVLQFSWTDRRRVAKALRKGHAIDDADRPVADALIRTMRQQRWLPYLFGAIILLNLARAILEDGFQRIVGIVLAAGYAILIPVLLRQRRTMIANYERTRPAPKE